MDDLVARLRLLEQDHEPDGWPAVRMRDITAILDALEATREGACVALVADIRFACGDNGKRMQPELVEFIRELASGYERMKDALEMMAEQHRCGCGHPHCNNCARDKVCAAALAP